MWICEDCRTSNAPGARTCVVCDARRPTRTAPTKSASTQSAPSRPVSSPAARNRTKKGKSGIPPRPRPAGDLASLAPRPAVRPTDPKRRTASPAPVPRPESGGGSGVGSAIFWALSNAILLFGMFTAVARYFPGVGL
jgi:hypothetical protein